MSCRMRREGKRERGEKGERERGEKKERVMMRKGKGMKAEERRKTDGWMDG